jgi:putative ABC transport system permease protein
MRGACADVGYFDLLGLDIIRGRDFIKAADPDKDVQWIINEEAARIMGFEDPVGQPLSQADFKGTIVGVVKNYHFTALREKIDPLVTGYHPGLSQVLFVKLRPGKIPDAIRAVESVWKKFAPRDEFRYRFLNDAVDALYRSEERIGAVLKAFTILAVFVSCLGLFGLASFLAEQRTKEIGIRKVLGASTADVVFLFSREFMIGVAAANAIACPAAYYFVQKWLRGYAYRIAVGPAPFLFAAVLALAVALMTVSIRFIRAARTRPAETLKYE